jgi:hypothetical protein
VAIANRIAEVLSPHLGSQTADAVARHLCARHGIEDEAVDLVAVASLQEAIRKGLIPFVGPAVAEELARRCF